MMLPVPISAATIMIAIVSAAVTTAVLSVSDPVSGMDRGAHATHVSVPVITTGNYSGHIPDDGIIIAGWVDYGGSPASKVLLAINVSDPRGQPFTEHYTTSGPDGEFSYLFAPPRDSTIGDYAVTVTSMCREEHRQICSYQTDSATISLHGTYHAAPHIPQWVKIIAGFWISGQINDVEFARAMEFLIRDGTIIIPRLDEGSTKGALPEQIQEHAALWVSGQSTDAAFARDIARLAGTYVANTGAIP